nr:DUF6011 domain-containing protein [Candidatus Sigynarchaeota archaeon]
MSIHVEKNLLGSIKYGIQFELIETIDALEKIYVKVSFYFNHRKENDIIVDDFKSLIQQLIVFWVDVAKLDVFPERLAAWLSDYLQEIGYPKYDFPYVLRLIKGIKKDMEHREKAQKTLGTIETDVKTSVKKLDVNVPVENVGAFMLDEMDKHVTEVPNKVNAEIIFIDANDKVSSIQSEPEIQPKNELESDVLLQVTTQFTNPIDTKAHDVQVNNIIPYDYKVLETSIVGFEKIEPKKTLLDEGLQLTWILPEVEPKAEIKVDVRLERRITRTVLLKENDELSVLKTYFNILPAGDDKFYIATDSFKNAYTVPLEHLVIEDQIPLTYSIFSADPSKDINAINQGDKQFDNLVKWHYDRVDINSKLDHSYTLLDHHFFILNSFEPVPGSAVQSSIVKLIEPNTFYNEAIVSYYIKDAVSARQDVLFIREGIQENVSITYSFPPSVERILEVVDDKVSQIWRVPKDCNEFGYVCRGIKSIGETPVEVVVPPSSTNSFKQTETNATKRLFFLPGLHEQLETMKTVPDKVGLCTMCGRKLKSKQSMDRGMGPECYKRFLAKA